MEKTIFKVGDVVRLKSGGPAMTVSELDKETVTVSWFQRLPSDAPHYNSPLFQHNVPAACLIETTCFNETA